MRALRGKSYLLSVALASVSFCSVGASAVYAQEARPRKREAQFEEPGSDIIVTGTRRSERTAIQSLSPIDIIDADTLGRSPSADLNDRLAAAEPSFNVQRMPGSDGVIFSRPAALRNLSPDQTLVLVNGHRRHRSAYVDIVNRGAEAVDLAQIPVAAIGRIEVLRDGASAQYGSDAIGGVINILLDHSQGTVISAQAAQYYAGDGFGVQLSGRSGLKLADGGYVSVSGDYNNSNATDRSVGIRNKIGQPDLESYHAALDLKIPINNDVDFYTYGTLGKTTGWSEFSYRSEAAGDAVFARSAYQDGADPIYPAWSLTSLYPDGFASQFGAVTVDGEIRAGVTAVVAPDLNLDISVGYGRNSIRYKVRNSINASLGPVSPTRFDAGRIAASEASANADATYLLDVGLVKPVSIAFGGSYTRERFETTAGDPASYAVGPLSDLPSGSYGFPGLAPSDARASSRGSEAGYLDVEADLTRNLTIGAAGRYEHFSDFGANLSYKLSARYQVADWLALRATYNTGFHAPAPGQQNFTRTQTMPDPTQPAPYPVITVGLVSPSDPLARPFGGRPLKPEKSENVSVGIVATPTHDVTLTVDYYHIKIRDRITLTPQLPLGGGQAFDQIQFLLNGYNSSNNGVDVVLSWSRPLWGGRWGLTAAYNYNDTKITKALANIPLNVFRPLIEDIRPHNTLIVSGNYDRGRFHAAGRLRYFGSFIDALPIDPAPFENQKVSPLALVDLSVSYDLAHGTQFTVGAENIFNSYPDRANSIVSFLGYKYPLTRPYEEDGGRWYVRVTQKF